MSEKPLRGALPLTEVPAAAKRDGAHAFTFLAQDAGGVKRGILVDGGQRGGRITTAKRGVRGAQELHFAFEIHGARVQASGARLGVIRKG